MSVPCQCATRLKTLKITVLSCSPLLHCHNLVAHLELQHLLSLSPFHHLTLCSFCSQLCQGGGWARGALCILCLSLHTLLPISGPSSTTIMTDHQLQTDHWVQPMWTERVLEWNFGPKLSHLIGFQAICPQGRGAACVVPQKQLTVQTPCRWNAFQIPQTCQGSRSSPAATTAQPKN